jgi:hypothetical protein
MRRTFLFAFVLLVVSATSAFASAAGSTQAHRKASAHARSSAHARTRPAAKRTTVRKSTSAVKRNVRYTRTRANAISSVPETSNSANPPSGANPAYAIGYRNGYDAGRAAALKELQSQSANNNLNARPAQSAPPSAPQTTGTPEPSDADPAANSTTAQQPAQYKTEALRKQGEAEAADTSTETPGFEIATLELPRAGTSISLRGSLESLQRQNTRLEAEGMERILDEDDLNSRIAHHLLTPLPASANLLVNPSLPENRRYCRAWTARFLTDLAKAHAAAFHRPFQVNSAVRSVQYQKRLMRTNGNAASAEGDIVSPHLTGATIDIGKQGMTRAELLWMRRTLFALQSAGRIDVEEEFEQACFHITVYKTYSARPPAKKLAQPAVRDASAPAPKPAAPARRRGSSLPTSIAAGTFAAPGE